MPSTIGIDLDKWEPLAEAPANPKVPSAPPADQPYAGAQIVATIPINTQLQPDLTIQNYQGSVPEIRVIPPQAAANPQINAAAQSQALAVAAGKTGSLEMPNIFAVGGDAPLTATGGEIDVTLVPEQEWTFFAGPYSGISGIGVLDNVAGYGGVGTPATHPFTVGPQSPSTGTDYALFVAIGIQNSNNYVTIDTPAGWSVVQSSGIGPAAGFSKLVSGSTTFNVTAGGGTNLYDWETILALFKTVNGTASVVQVASPTAFTGASTNLAFTNPVTSGNTIIVIGAINSSSNLTAVTGITDTLGQTYVQAFAQRGPINPFSAFESVWMHVASQITTSGSDTLTIATATSGSINTADVWAIEVSGLQGPTTQAVPTFRHILPADLQFSTFGPSGPGHSPGSVPDPGSTAGTTHFLREDATWAVISSGTINAIQGTVNFGNLQMGVPLLEDTTAKVTVSAPWVTANSIITATPTGGGDHPDSDEAAAEGLTVSAGNLVVGTSFDITVQAPNGSWGQWVINAIGVG